MAPPQTFPGSRPICASLGEAVGRTPLVRASRFVTTDSVEVYLKLESMNPTGSSKDRSARAMLDDAEGGRRFPPGTVIIISSSGNMGIALASLAAQRAYRLLCVVDPKISSANEALLRLLGACVVKVTEQDDAHGYHRTRQAKAHELATLYRGSVYLDQYDNPSNVGAHYTTTAREIFEDLNGQVDAVVIPAGTGGTLIGCARFFKEYSPNTHIWAVDEYGSVALPNEHGPAPRLLNGMGTSTTPANYPSDVMGSLVDYCHYVYPWQAISSAVELARSEGIAVGGSGGAAAFVLKRYASKHYDRLSRIVGILPDHGARYVDSLYSNEWLREHCVPFRVDDAPLPETVDQPTPTSIRKEADLWQRTE